MVKYRDWKIYNEARKHETGEVLASLVGIVMEKRAPYRVRAPGTRGRPPENPRYVVIVLLVKVLFNHSYRDVYSFLNSGRANIAILGMDHVPHYNTVQAHSHQISEIYINSLFKALLRDFEGGRSTLPVMELASERSSMPAGSSVELETRRRSEYL